MMGTQYARGATRPELHLWLYNDDGELIDFSVVGWTFVVRIGDRGKPALKEINTGIIGAAGSGDEETPGSIPNLRIAWNTGDLDITPGEYVCQIMADSGGGAPRYFFRDIEITDIVLAPA